MEKNPIIEANLLKGIALKLRTLSDNDDTSETRMLRAANLTASGYHRLIEVESCTLTTLARLSNYYRKPIRYWFSQEALAAFDDNAPAPRLDLPEIVRTPSDIDEELVNLRELVKRQRAELEELKSTTK